VIEDYDVYIYSKKEWFQYFIQGAMLGISIGLLFYANIFGAILLGGYGFIFVKN